MKGHLLALLIQKGEVLKTLGSHVLEIFGITGLVSNQATAVMGMGLMTRHL